MHDLPERLLEDVANPATPKNVLVPDLANQDVLIKRITADGVFLFFCFFVFLSFFLLDCCVVSGSALRKLYGCALSALRAISMQRYAYRSDRTATPSLIPRDRITPVL